MSDFHLDDPSVLINFEEILMNYEQQYHSSDGVIRPPPVWVLCGNFSKKPFIFDDIMTLQYIGM